MRRAGRHQRVGQRAGGQLQFTAGFPSAAFVDTFPTGATTATVDGTVNAAGQATTYDLEYDVASSPWCSSDGATGSAANVTASQQLGFTDATDHPVSFTTGGLVTGTAYCGRIVATNGSGTFDGTIAPSFFDASPVESTMSVSAASATAVTVDATVNPVGQTTTYMVEYDLASSSWCMSDGFSGSPANTTAPLTLPFTDAVEHNVTVSVPGLSAATDYCVELVAVNASGTGDDGVWNVSTPASAPVVITGPASTVTQSAATVAGTVNPSGDATNWHVEYGATTSYGSVTPSNDAGSGSTTQQAAATLAGLSPGTTYHYRLVATNSLGTTDGGDRTFTTAAPPIAPAVTTGSASAITATGASVAGRINPNGQATTYHFEYGTSIAYGSSTPQTSAGSGSSDSSVSASLTGLRPHTTYHYRLVATSSVATTNGSDRSFTTRGPSPVLTAVGLANSTFPARKGTTLHFTLSEPARVTIVITTTVKGRRIKGACKPAAKHGTRCTLIVTKATLTVTGVAGRNTARLRFGSLKPGRYAARLTARDAAGELSKPVTLQFTISAH